MATILVVDDDSQTIEQLTRLISEAGHSADFLLEPQYLLPKLETDPIDLILLDVNMPEVDGLSLLKKLKANHKTEDIPVLMITGDTEEKLVQACFEAGAVDFLNKPIRPLELQSRIRIALETQEHIAAIQSQKNDLQQTKAFIETILDSMEESICVIDRRDNTILEANQVFINQIGLPRGLVIGRKCFDKPGERTHPCFQCDGPDKDCILKDELEPGKSRIRELIHLDKNKERIFTKVITRPILSGELEDNRVLYLARDITKAKRMEEKLKHLAFHDVLTGLPNRQLFFDRLEQALAQARRHDQLLAVLFFDLDRFKEVNDTLGHNIGDLLLKEVGSRLAKGIRESDTVARLGGDEFTAFLTNLDELEDVRKTVRKLLKSLGRKFQLKKHKLSVTSSIGVSLFPHDGDTLQTLTKKADKALYKAKSDGRNNAQFFSLGKKIK
ncbi:MAG: diguanylate cyclase [Magnetococcales bacterium]|nr:diguanylate cyclase [Magnetococcales bacterium]